MKFIPEELVPKVYDRWAMMDKDQEYKDKES